MPQVSVGLTLAVKAFVPGGGTGPKPFTPTPLVIKKPEPPVDKEAEALKKNKWATEEEEIKGIKEALATIRKMHSEAKNGVITMDLFAEIGKLKICETEDIDPTDLSSMLNPAVCGRETREIEPNARGGQRKNYDNKNRNNYNNNNRKNDYNNNMNRPD